MPNDPVFQPISEAAFVNPPLTKYVGPDDEVSFIPMADVSESGQRIGNQTRRQRKVSVGYTPFEEGDVLFAKITPCMENGKGFHAIGLVNGVGYGSTEFHILRARPGTNGRFLYYWSMTEAVRKKAEAFMIGSAGQQRVQASFFGYFRIPRLEEDEQLFAASILDAADEAIAKTESLIAKLKAIKQGLLQDLLTRGLDDNGQLRDPEMHPEQFKQSSLGLIPRDWTLKTLSDLADVDRGKFMHRPRNDPRFYGGEHPFVQTGDVAAADGSVLNAFSQTLNARGASVSQEFPEGTIAITIAANIADTAILGRPMYFPDSIVGAIVRPPNVIRYIELWIRYRKNWLSAQAPQSAQKNINLETLRPLIIPVPNPEEQREIAKVYELLDSRIQSEEDYLSKLKAIKKGLMQDLLTGRVRVSPGAEMVHA